MGSGVWPKAVRDGWPEVVDPATGEVLAATPRLTRCEYHLRATLRSVMRATGILQPREEDPFVAAPPPSPWAKPTTSARSAGSASSGRTRRNAPWTPELGRKRTGLSKAARAAQKEGWHQLSQLLNGDQHPLIEAADKAFDTVEVWDALVAMAARWQARPLDRWLADYGFARDQIANRDWRVPRTIGGLEGALVTVRRMLRDRAHLLNNTVRTNRLLDLMTLQLRGVADERAYAARILEALAPAGGHAPRQRLGVTGAARLHT